MTRTLLVNGEGVSAESHPLFNVYQIVLQAQLAAISAIRPGVRCQQVDEAARRVITEQVLATISVITPLMLSALKFMKIRVFHRGTPRRYSQACY